MIRISKTSRLSPGEIVLRASRFFGEAGEGLEETERGACCVAFAGGGGHVRVSASEDDGGCSVDVESREFDYQARKFLETV